MTRPDPLRAVEMLALLEEATTPLCHDIRNRIASIRNLSYFVRRKLASEVAPERDPRVNEFLSKIEGEVQRTDALIDAWSSRVHPARTLELARVRVSDCVRLAIDSARLPAQVAVEFICPRESFEVEAELEALVFALRCILENAGEASGGGSLSVAAEREAGQCMITVVDGGPGIADPVRCLEPFESTKPGHLGLGLGMARRIVMRYGGDLLIGNPERGAQVSLLVPLSGFAPAPRAEQ